MIIIIQYDNKDVQYDNKDIQYDDKISMKY